MSRVTLACTESSQSGAAVRISRRTLNPAIFSVRCAGLSGRGSRSTTNKKSQTKTMSLKRLSTVCSHGRNVHPRLPRADTQCQAAIKGCHGGERSEGGAARRGGGSPGLGAAPGGGSAVPSAHAGGAAAGGLLALAGAPGTSGAGDRGMLHPERRLLNPPGGDRDPPGLQGTNPRRLRPARTW